MEQSRNENLTNLAAILTNKDFLKKEQRQYPWGHQRRYNNYAEYFRKTFGKRVQKVTIDAGFTCPNRDGTKGIGGCTY